MRLYKDEGMLMMSHPVTTVLPVALFICSLIRQEECNGQA
jgi:hypothetical protein